MKKAKHKYDLSNKRRKRRTNKNIFFMFAALVVVGGVLFLLRMPQMRIGEITVQNLEGGTDGVRVEEIQKIALAEISGNHYFIFPRNNVLLYPKKELESRLARSFPDISEFRLNLSLDRRLSIYVKPRVLDALWCRGAECFLLDNSGFVFAKSSGNELKGYLRFEGAIGGDPIGQTFGSPELFGFLGRFVQSLGALGLHAESVKIFDQDRAEAAVGGGSRVFFTPDPSKESELNENLKLFVDNLKEKNGGALPNFEYIDARYGNKIFYKLKI